MVAVKRINVKIGPAELSLLHAGTKQGTPVVLLHGIPASAELWRPIIIKLAESGHQVYAPDLPGYGYTRLSKDGDYSLVGAAELIASWLKQQKIAPVWLVGHDIGGGIAQVLAVRYPRLIKLLTMGDTLVADSWPVTPVKLFQLAAKLGLYPMAAAAHLVPNRYAWYALRQAFADSSRLTPEIASRVFWEGKVKDRQGRKEFARHLKALDPNQTITAAKALRDLTVPTLLIWGRDDRFQPWETVGQRLKSLLPDPDVVVLKNAGHFLPLEKPDAYVQTMLSWKRALKYSLFDNTIDSTYQNQVFRTPKSGIP